MLRNLYALQELDTEINESRNTIVSLDGQIGDRKDLDALSGEIETRKESLGTVRLKQRAQDLDAESVREKLKGIEDKLYSGRITNLKELEGHEKEAGFLRNQLQELDDKLLVTMEELEGLQKNIRTLENRYIEGEEQWQIKQKELAEQRKEEEQTLNSLEARRQDSVSRVGQRELKLYEDLRVSKGGQAISVVERGMCRVCRMGLPTTQLQRARVGREPVFCGSCGRILLIV